MTKKSWSNIALALIKLTVFLGCVGIGIHYLQTHQPQWTEIRLSSSALFLVPGIVLLAGFNWFIESLKWRQAIKRIRTITISTAVKATLSGVATSFVTPFRIGDFVGKVMYLKDQKRKGTLLTFYANFCQLWTTLLFGMIGLSVMSLKIISIDGHYVLFLMILGWSTLAVLFLLALVPGSIARLVKIAELLSVNISDFSMGIRNSLSIFGFAILRYIIFLIQFVMAFRLFNNAMLFIEIASLISILYLLITFIPSPFLGKIGVRESVALFLIGPYESSSVIIAASLLIWLINLFLPALIGTIYFSKVNSLKA